MNVPASLARTIAWLFESRSIAFPAESRIIAATAESRAIGIAAESRSLTISAERSTLRMNPVSFEVFEERKDPDAVLDYTFNWLAWLGTDTIVTSTWIVPTGIVKDSDSHTTTATTIWVSGGTAGTSYDLTNRIVTTAGRTEDRTGVIKCKER